MSLTAVSRRRPPAAFAGLGSWAIVAALMTGQSACAGGPNASDAGTADAGMTSSDAGSTDAGSTATDGGTSASCSPNPCQNGGTCSAGTVAPVCACPTGFTGTTCQTATNTNERTLDDCTTSIDPSAPDFYKRYFRCVTITTTSDSVVIQSTDLPPHRSYYYGSGNPNYTDFDTRGGTYHPEPNKISSQNLKITVPNAPVSRGLTITASMVDGMAGTDPNEYSLGPVGVALDSVALFNDLAAPGMTLDVEKYTFDSYNGHPQMNGMYHYHENSPGPLEVLAKNGYITNPTIGSAGIELYGIMCDGTVVLGCTELDGSAPNTADFDAQNGHVGDIADASGTVYFKNRYHVHICTTSMPSRAYTPEIQYYTTCGNH